jgi:hypothetical protein
MMEDSGQNGENRKERWLIVDRIVKGHANTVKTAQARSSGIENDMRLKSLEN